MWLWHLRTKYTKSTRLHRGKWTCYKMKQDWQCNHGSAGSKKLGIGIQTQNWNSDTGSKKLGTGIQMQNWNSDTGSKKMGNWDTDTELETGSWIQGVNIIKWEIGIQIQSGVWIQKWTKLGYRYRNRTGIQEITKTWIKIYKENENRIRSMDTNTNPLICLEWTRMDPIQNEVSLDTEPGKTRIQDWD